LDDGDKNDYTKILNKIKDVFKWYWNKK
jgi:hypothetical protein